VVIEMLAESVRETALPKSVDLALVSDVSEVGKSAGGCPFKAMTNRLSGLLKVQPERRRTGEANLLAVRSWIVNFVAKPNVKVGRQGPVCPFLPRALQENTLSFFTLNAAELSEDDLDESMKRFAERFAQTEPCTGKARLNKAFVIVLENLGDTEAARVVEGTQARLKRFFVERGLMLGEFHKNHQGTGLHSREFRPLQSPVPLLVIRHMIPSDLPFLLRQSDSLINRVNFVTSYIFRFGATLSPLKKKTAFDTFAELLQRVRSEYLR
jgi:hypothetical protein